MVLHYYLQVHEFCDDIEKQSSTLEDSPGRHDKDSEIVVDTALMHGPHRNAGGRKLQPKTKAGF